MRSLLLILVSLLLSPLASRGDEPLMPGKLQCDKVLFLGNSITRHGPLAEIGWTGDWGMAASTADNDYVALVVRRLTNAVGARPQVMVRNIADFERRYSTYDVEAGLKEELAFDADLIIVAVGENVPALDTKQAQQAYAAAFENLLAKFTTNGKTTLIVRSSFWADETKDSAMQTACEKRGGVYVKIGALGKEEANYARSERKIEHAGVANHPGDRGMKAIADMLWKAIEERATR